MCQDKVCGCSRANERSGICTTASAYLEQLWVTLGVTWMSPGICRPSSVFQVQLCGALGLGKAVTSHTEGEEDIQGYCSELPDRSRGRRLSRKTPLEWPAIQEGREISSRKTARGQLHWVLDWRYQRRKLWQPFLDLCPILLNTNIYWIWNSYVLIIVGRRLS